MHDTSSHASQRAQLLMRVCVCVCVCVSCGSMSTCRFHLFFMMALGFWFYCCCFFYCLASSDALHRQVCLQNGFSTLHSNLSGGHMGANIVQREASARFCTVCRQSFHFKSSRPKSLEGSNSGKSAGRKANNATHTV